MHARAHPCQIFLTVEAGTGCAERLRAALAASPVASVLIYSEGAGLSTPASLKTLVYTAQRTGSAVLLADDPATANAVSADGIHLTATSDPLTRYQEARAILGKDAIVGVDCGGSRHLAMEVGEAGADYIAFSDARVKLPPLTDDDPDHTPPADLSTLELVQWWSEIFEVPCVALGARDSDEQLAFLNAGADFLGLELPAGQSPDAIAAKLRATTDLISRSKSRS